jgi:hypothetical protein
MLKNPLFNSILSPKIKRYLKHMTQKLTKPTSLPYFLTLAMTTFIILMLITIIVNADTPGGKIADRIKQLQQQHLFNNEFSVFTIAGNNSDAKISETVRNYSLMKINSKAEEILKTKPDYLSLMIPMGNKSGTFTLLLYKENISPSGFTVLTSTGKHPAETPDMVHYRGIINNDYSSVASISFSENEIMGLICNSNGNFVLGKIENNEENLYIVYNDRDLVPVPAFDCQAQTNIPLNHSNDFNANKLTSLKCVNWYWETDVDIYNGKQQSVANVTTYMNGIFNQVSTLYANDGMSISFQTLFVWDSIDPYTGPSTSDYLTQFGTNRTSFAGDLANLFGYQGGGGIAWINGFCSSTAHRMAYCGISSSFQTVPTYSWTVEVAAHEEGHLFGSNHTHDCVWNGNNTKIDACGDVAGYTSGSCPQTVPALPVGGGTIMSYCHLTNAGINLSLGFGPQPTTRMLNNENNATCLAACNGCPVPAQPGAISGNAAVCNASSQTYSVGAVSGATGYTWTLPSGWSGTSTTNSINVTAGNSGGNITVTANNNCGSSPVKSFTVTVSSFPSQPGNISGSTSVCQSLQQSYSVASVAGATSYSWTLPSGWSGTSASNSITTTPGSTGGTISIKAVNACGSGNARTLSVAVSALPAVPGNITATGGNSKVCPGDVKSYHINTVAGATSYTWTLPPGAGFVSGQGTNNITVSYTSGFTASDSLKVRAVNSCGNSGNRSLSIKRNTPLQPSVITGPANTLCNQSGVTYSVNAVSGISYNWLFSAAGATVASGQGTNSILADFTSGFVSGNLNVTAGNGCGISVQRTLTVKSAPATPVTINGAVTVCANQQLVPYSIAPVTGASSYTWTGPSGSRISDGITTSTTATLTTPSPNVTVNFKTTAGILKVKANNSCGSGNFRNLTINFNCREGAAIENGNPSISISPNPAHDQLSVAFETAEKSAYTIDVIDPAGRIVQSHSSSSVSNEVNEQMDIASLAKGIYLLRIKTVDGISTKRFIVQ